MKPFTELNGTTAPLDLVNVDTDMIIPKQFLKTIERSGLGKGLFHELRFDADGAPIDSFPLNQPQ
jgi:3-isopropylmalate/(R)-2-methylmalate dehydratase small subunit